MSLPAAYFEALYGANPDPWGFTTRLYEHRKYALTLASLPRQRYRRTFEPGCSIGVLTRLLAKRSEKLLAWDVSPSALSTARATSNADNVAFAKGTVPDEWPDGGFDLVVFSELGYYFSSDDLESFVDQAWRSLDPDGHLVAVHWRARTADYPATADAVHGYLLGASPFLPLAHYEDEHFLLDVLGRGSGAGIAGPED